MKVLLSGFDPFGGDKINPAYEAVKLVPKQVAGAEIVKIEVPTIFKESAEVLKQAIQKENPDIVICVGQAGGRAAVSLERVAINLAEARIPDNKGQQPLGEKLEEDGENAYFTSLPIKAMMKNMHENGFPGYISYTAGTFVCNDIMYRLLYMLDREFSGVRGGFIHVPFLPEQVVERPVNTPSMSLEDMGRALTSAVEAAILNQEDIDENAGTTH